MSAAIKGLTKENALLLLETKNVNIEDQKSILINAGVITSEEAETMAIFANTSATTANTTAKKANLKWVNLLKVAYAKLKAVMLANPLTAMAIALGLVTTAVIGVTKWFGEAGKRAKEVAEKSREAFNQTKSEIDQINSSLQTTKNRIDELNAKENLSLVETEELQKLKESNDELERELRIKEALAKTQGKEANDKAVKYFNSKTNHVEYSTGADGKVYVSDSTNYSLIDSVERKLSRIPEMKQSLKDLQKQLEKIEDTDTNYKNNSDWLNLKSSINRAENELADYQKFVDDSIADFMETDDSLIEGIDDGILERLDSIYNLYDEITNGIAQSHTNTISAVFDKVYFKGIKDELVQLGKEGKLSIDLLSSKFPQLIRFLDDAGISAEELYKYIMNLASPDAVKYGELKRQLQEVMGFGDGIHTLWAANLNEQLQNLGLYKDDALEAFAAIKAKYINGETETWTSEDWIANIQEELNGSNGIKIDADITFDDALEKSEGIQSSISTLRSALDSLNSGSLDESAVLDLMQQFPDLIPYIDLAADGFGNLSEGLSTLIEQQPDSLIQSLELLKESLNTDEEREQVDALINSLQLLSSYGDTGMEAYAASVGSTWDDTANVIENVTTQFENLAKVQEAVADGLTMSATAATELAKMYPEILTNAEVSANGQITLNEDVVKSILDGDQSIINAQISKLEADKAELEAKKSYAEAQLNMVKQVAEGEGSITKEVAQYRLDIANELLKVLVEAGLEEDRAYAAVAANMAGNMNEYSRIVGEVAEDTSANMNAAAVSMANSIHINSINAQTSFQNLQKKVWDLADSIKAAANGERAGNSGTYGGGGSSSGSGMKKVDRTSDFTKAVVDFSAKSFNLNDFQSKLEIDIKGYMDAISNIDAQIDVLKNLQATFNANGGVGGHGYADKIKDLEKEKDKINKALDGAKGSSKEAKDEFEELFDFFERRVTVLDDALSLLKTNLDNVMGAFAKNKLVDAQLDITEEKFKNYSDALNMYTQKANEALSKLPSDIAAKIKDGAVDLTTFIGDGNEEVVEAIKDYEKWADKVADCKQELAELKTAIRQLELEKFNNIMEDFTNQFDLREDGKDLISKQIDLLKEAGQLIGESFFHSQIDQSKKQLALLEEEKTQLVNQMSSSIGSGKIQKGTDEWLEMVNALSDLEGNILDCKKAIEEFDNELLQLHWDIFDRINGQFKDLDSELSNLRELFDNSKVTDDNLNWSREALAQLGLLAQQYELAQYQVQKYNDELNRLNSDYLSGRYSATEYADKLSDLTSAQWDAVNSSEAVLDAIHKLNEVRVNEEIDSIEKEIKAYKELIDAQIDALKAAKDLHDYQQSIAEKTKSVTDLERQIAAMQNDNTSATIAKRKQLEEQLAEAKKALEEAEYEHSIEAQEDALNKQYENYESERNAEIEALKASLEERETLIAESFEAVKQNADVVGQEIANIATEHGITVSNAIIASWKNGETAIASYGGVLSSATSAFIGNIMGVEDEVYALQYQANETADALAWMFSTRADSLVNELVSSYYSEQNLNAMTQALHDSLINTLEGGYNIGGITSALDGIASGLNSVASAANNAASAIASMGAAQANYNNLSNSSGTKYYNTNTTKLPETVKSGSIKTYVPEYTWYNGKRYASGTRNAKGGIRVINEEGQELVLPKLSSGNYAIGNDGDQILTKDETDNVYGWAKVAPEDFMSKLANVAPNLLSQQINIPSMAKMPKIIPNNVNRNNVTMHYDSLVTINGDVNDTKHFLNDMKTVADGAIKKSWHDFEMTRKYGVY